MRIAVVDVETTGFSIARGDRVVEIAVVGLTDGAITDEFVTLVNPGREIAATDCHGITSEEVFSAPTFSELVGDLLERFDGAVALVAHNAPFDKRFIDAEFGRCGVNLPSVETVCTMKLSGGGLSLSYCCDQLGIPEPAEAHSALDDARAAAQILSHLLSHKIEIGLGPAPPWPRLPKTGRSPVTRTQMRERISTNPYLERLALLSESTHDMRELTGEGMAYLAVLTRVLEDRRIDESEGIALIEMAQSWGLTISQIESLHNEFLRGMAAAALLDGVVTDAERKDLAQVCRLLGRPANELDRALNFAEGRIQRTPVSKAGDHDLAGKSVCFTGQLISTLRGVSITREQAQRFAAGAGLVVKPSVTRKLDVLVVADPYTLSGKAETARKYGTRILAEAVFWKAIGVEVD